MTDEQMIGCASAFLVLSFVVSIDRGGAEPDGRIRRPSVDWKTFFGVLSACLVPYYVVALSRGLAQ